MVPDAGSVVRQWVKRKEQHADAVRRAAQTEPNPDMQRGMREGAEETVRQARRIEDWFRQRFR